MSNNHNKFFIILFFFSLTLLLSKTFSLPQDFEDFNPPNYNSFFQKKYMNVDEMIKDKNIYDQLSDLEVETNECLVTEEEAKQILREKYNLNPDFIPIDKNLRFILGKCDPVIYVPGLYGSRIVATFNCPVFRKDFLNFAKMRLFCGTSICKDEQSGIEDHIMFPNAFGGPFQLRVTDDVNKYSGCLGFFFKFFNRKNECPEDSCEYSDGVRISFYGGSDKSKGESKCGIKALEDILDTSGIIPSFLANKMITANFYMMIAKYRKMGYKDGFSQAGLSYDYRKFLFSDKYFSEAFEYQINRLYKNTGKRVVLIGHSLGCLKLYDQLVSMKPELKKKIKAFVPIAPPFAGAGQLLTAYLYGLDIFDTTIKIGNIEIMKIQLNLWGESLAYGSVPVVAELRPQYGLANAFSKPEYARFKSAIEDLIQEEKICGGKNCPADQVLELTKNYREVFGEDFPTFDKEECQLDPEDIYDDDSEQLDGGATYHRRCRTQVFDLFTCPMLVYEDELGRKDVSALEIKNLCGNYNSSMLYNIDGTCLPPTPAKIFGYNEEKIPLDRVYYGNAKYPYNRTEFQELLERYNEKFAGELNQRLSLNNFPSNEDHQLKGLNVINHLKNNSRFVNLPVPPVDTYLVYANYMNTETAMIYDKINKNNKRQPERNERLYRGGDGTVPNYSSFLTGMKWLFDKKKDGLEQDIKLIEYCSSLGKEGNKYAYNHETFKNKSFMALNCDCLKEDGKHYDREKLNGCQHSGMPGDSYIIDLIAKEIMFDEDWEKVTDEKRKAIKMYDNKFNYEINCNEGLLHLVKEDSDTIKEEDNDENLDINKGKDKIKDKECTN